MTLAEYIETLDKKMEEFNLDLDREFRQFNLDRETGRISAYSLDNLDNYEYLTGYLTGQDLEPKPEVIWIINNLNI